MYQSYNAESVTGLSEAGLNKMRLKEQKKKFKEAKKAAKNADKAAKYEADTLKKQRLKGARDILDKAGYTDVRVSNNMAPSAPACGASTYGAKVASANRKLKNDAMRAKPVAQYKPVRQAQPMRQAQPVRQVQPSRYMGAAPARSYALAPARSMNARPVQSMAKKPAYGYYSDGNRRIPVPITQQGTVRQDYLRAASNGRPARAIETDRAKTASVVYPAKMTPQQAQPWLLNPGHGDIVGIDAPRSARPNMYVSANRKNPRPYLKYQVPTGEESCHVRMEDSRRNPYYVKVTPSGKVSKDYLEYINAERPKSARAMDAKKTSSRVIRRDPTPYQAAPWIQNPGKYDISGIDTEGGALVPATVKRPTTAEIAAEMKQKQWAAAQKKGAAANKAKAKARREAAGEAEAKKKSSGKPKAKAQGKAVKEKAPAKEKVIKTEPKTKNIGVSKINTRASDFDATQIAGDATKPKGTIQSHLAAENRKGSKVASANRKSSGKTRTCGKSGCSSKSKSCNSKTACKGCNCNRK